MANKLPYFVLESETLGNQQKRYNSQHDKMHKKLVVVLQPYQQHITISIYVDFTRIVEVITQSTKSSANA